MVHLIIVPVMQMADFGLSRVLEANATHVSTFTYGEQAAQPPDMQSSMTFLLWPVQHR